MRPSEQVRKQSPRSIAQDGLLLPLALLTIPLAGWALIAYTPSRIDELIRQARGVYDMYAAHAKVYLGLVILTLVWERLLPVLPGSMAWRGMREDLCWVVVKPFFDTAVAGAGIMFGFWLHAHALHGATLAAAAGWPRVVRIAVAFVIVDLLLYVTHVVRHRVPLFWRFHAMHHSQSRLNFFSEDRNHPVDVLLTRLPIVLAVRLLGISPRLGFAVGMLTWWHGHFIHANVRFRFGPLRALLVTPQSHRLHHSCDPEHRDRNFGTHLAIWDRMFGTQHPDDRLYPPTGLPGERALPERTSIATLYRELLRPFA